MPHPHIRRATRADISQILGLYAAAHDFMRRTGNPTQWPAHYPGMRDVEEDLARDALYVWAEDDDVRAVFFFSPGPDPTYATIDGAWLNDEPYGVVHRIAAREGSGTGRACLAWACEQVPNLRIDTHERNAPMRRALERLGFVECGTIICENGTPRIAYHHARTE